jgi:hypothetical protein
MEFTLPCIFYHTKYFNIYVCNDLNLQKVILFNTLPFKYTFPMSSIHYFHISPEVHNCLYIRRNPKILNQEPFSCPNHLCLQPPSNLCNGSCILQDDYISSLCILLISQPMIFTGYDSSSCTMFSSL